MRDSSLGSSSSTAPVGAVGAVAVGTQQVPDANQGGAGPPTLKKPLRVLDIWALGVGVVITGEYFGWNFGLAGNGPIAMLIASLVVCLLYLTWVLALAELSVAMPYAGGPLAYGRRAVGPWLGFLMGWSMFLECQFATIATALATGGYIAFLFNPHDPSPQLAVWTALATVVIFFVLHVWGVKEQSMAMVVMTYGAIGGLVLFWGLAATNFSWDRVWTSPVFPVNKGWQAVLDAVPYALWWLVMIETVALAAEEAHESHRTIPRGLVWAQLTLIVLVVMTLVFACGAVDDTEQLGAEAVTYPLAKVVGDIPIGRSPIAVYGFGTIALFGMIASYHGMVFGTSRQAFALGRSGYLPRILGEVHAARRTPIPALALCSMITVAFIIANLWFPKAIAVAVLVSALTALAWYILAIVCLVILRRREGGLFVRYRAPLARTLPFAVIVLSAFAAWFFTENNMIVLWLTAALYAVGLGYYWLWSQHRLDETAPEEMSARQGAQVPWSGSLPDSLSMVSASGVPGSQPDELTIPTDTEPGGRRSPLVDGLTAAIVLAVLASVGWMIAVANGADWMRLASPEIEVVMIVALLTGSLLLVSFVALLHTRK